MKRKGKLGLKPLPPRDWFMVGLIVAYFCLVLAASLTATDRGMGDVPVFTPIADAAASFPYLTRVQASMSATGYSEVQITEKLRFLKNSYAFMFLGYVGAVLALVAGLLIWGVRTDPLSGLIPELDEGMAKGLVVALAAFAVAALLLGLVGIYGLGPFPSRRRTLFTDYIAETDWFIARNLLLVTGSLAFSIGVTRIGVAYAYVRLKQRR